MTSDPTWRARAALVALAVLLVGSSVAPVVGAATAQSDSILTRDADLVVREPGYTDQSVEPTTADGQVVYPVQGERVWLRPANFNATDVQDFGVEGGNATLEYDAAMGAFTFQPAGDRGTFTAYWIVREPVAVNRTVEQTVERPAPNGSNTTVTVTENVTRTATEYRQVRYEAIVKVTGGTNLAHVPDSRIDQLEQSAANWEELNATIQDIKSQGLLLWELTGTDPSTETILQGMVDTYVTTRDPPRLLRGSLRKFLLVMVLSLGGLLYFAIREGFAALVMRRLKKELGIYQSTEHAEGDVSERIFEVDRRERERASANLDYADRHIDPEANAMREAFGETPREGFENYANHILPGVWLTDRLKAMGQCGYAARVTERTAPDGGADDVDGELAVETAELVDLNDPRTDATLDDADIIDLSAIDGADPDLDLVFALLESDETRICKEFDLTTADFDADALDTSPLSFSLRELMDEIDLQFSHFESMEAAGEAAHEWIDVIHDSEYCEPDGTPRPARRAFNILLTDSQWLGDDGPELPQARLLSEHIERILIDYDPTRESAQLVKDIRDGKEVV